MKKLILIIALSLFSFHISADESQSTPDITQSWARATPPGTSTSAIYMTIGNNTNRTLKLVEARSPVTKRIEIHNTTKKDGMMQMRKIANIDIAKHTSVELKPNGIHLMLFDLKAPLTDGTKLSVELIFNNGKTVSIDVPVKKQALSDVERKMKMQKHKNH